MLFGGNAMRSASSLGFVLILGLVGASQAKATLSFCDTQPGNLITNCGFEMSDLTNWTLSGNTTNPPGGFNGSEYGVDGIDADTGNFGLYVGPAFSAMLLNPTLTLAPNTTYHISFELEQDHVSSDSGLTHSFSATFDGIPLLTLTNPAAAGSFVSYSYVETTGASLVTPSISFSFRNDDDYWSFDDVVVALQTTPEPASFVLVGAALTILGVVTARKRGKGLPVVQPPV
jgi:hypothetical protein